MCDNFLKLFLAHGNWQTMFSAFYTPFTLRIDEIEVSWDFNVLPKYIPEKVGVTDTLIFIWVTIFQACTMKAAECDHISTSRLLKITNKKSSVIVIIRLRLSLLVWTKVITLSGFYCTLELTQHSANLIWLKQWQLKSSIDKVILSELVWRDHKKMKYILTRHGS